MLNTKEVKKTKPDAIARYHNGLFDLDIFFDGIFLGIAVRHYTEDHDNNKWEERIEYQCSSSQPKEQRIKIT